MCITFWYQPAEDSLAAYIKTIQGYAALIWRQKGIETAENGAKEAWRQARIEINPNTPFQVFQYKYRISVRTRSAYMY